MSASEDKKLSKAQRAFAVIVITGLGTVAILIFTLALGLHNFLVVIAGSIASLIFGSVLYGEEKPKTDEIDPSEL